MRHNWHRKICSCLVYDFGAKCASLLAQTIKNLPAVPETWVQSLSWEDPVETGMATHSSTLDWRIPWTGEPGGPQSLGSQRTKHDWVTNTLLVYPWETITTIKVTNGSNTSLRFPLSLLLLSLKIYYIIYIIYIIYLAVWMLVVAYWLNWTCGVLVPWPGIEPHAPCIGRWILNHWTTREVPSFLFSC